MISAFQNKIFAYNHVTDGAREYLSDMFDDALNNGEISEELYNELQKQADSELTKQEMTDELKENLFFFAVGQYANISQDLVADSLLALSDIWDHIFWDNDKQEFGFDEGTGDFIKNGLESIIYNPAIETIGYWVPLPVTVNFLSRTRLIRHSDNFTGQAYITPVTNGYVVAYKGELIPGYTYWVQWTGDFTCGSFYNGSVDSGYYNYISGGTMTSSAFIGSYSTYSEALADFFGHEITDEPVLHDAIIVNENPTFPSLSPLGALSPNYKNIVINNYNNGEPYPPNMGLDINYYDYDYNYEVPFWGGHELETLPSSPELEFPSLEFTDIEVDENVDSALEMLEGSWLIEFLLIAILLLIVGLIL